MPGNSNLEAGRSIRRVYNVLSELPNFTSRPGHDPNLQQGLINQNFGFPNFIVRGTITDCTAVAHCYRVQLEKGNTVITAAFLAQTSLGAFGARQLNTLLVGTNVWVVVHPKSYYGVIVGVEPFPMTKATRSLIDQVSQASRTRVDEAHKRPLKMLGGGGVTDWTAGRPFDSTNVGEAGWITDTGMKIFIDPFMAQIAVDESTGVFCFYHDQLLRLAGYNFEHWTAGLERLALDDQGEYSDYTGSTPYPWEQLGLFEPGNPFRTLTPQQFQIDEPYYSRFEPSEDNQQPFHRTQEFRGYLGQGKRLVVAGPGNASAPVNMYGNTQLKLAGVFAENVSLGGAATTVAAKSLLFSKRAVIPVPLRRRRPEDPTGDTPDNYKAAGRFGNGKPHRITGNIEVENEPGGPQRAAGAIDAAAHALNFESLHAFHYHENDWDTPDESELEHIDKSQAVPTYSDLKTKHFLNDPPRILVQVDHRYGEVHYYLADSFFHMLEDGSIVITDGSGSEIRMHNGHIDITAAGNLNFHSGKNVNLWAGDDLIMRANNSADLSATQHDVRIKAENNMQLLAGNSGTGGILLESKATSAVYDFENPGEDVQSSGIVMRSKADIVGWAQNIYLRTGGADIPDGQIMLDAGKGRNNVVLYASQFDQFLTGAANHYFGDADDIGEVKVANQFTKTSTTLGTSLCVEGTAQLNGHLLMRGYINIVEGHIASEYSPQFKGLVGHLKDLPLYKVKSSLDECRTYATRELPKHGKDAFKSEVDELFYDEERPGEERVIQTAMFCFRNQEQYGTSDYQLYESRWQQMARLGGQDLATWEEKPVTCYDGDSYPYPGKEKFDEDCFYTVDPQLFDYEAGRCKDRDEEAYLTPQYGEVEATSLKSGYKVI